MMRRVAKFGSLLLSSALACGCSAAAAPATCDVPNIAPEQCADAHAMALPVALPASAGNKFADDQNAAQLGFSLFFDSNLGTGVSCATCHSPERAFTDRAPVSTGKAKGNRNAPTTFNAAHLSVFFWDGRADSLWSQALGPIENPVEMNSTRLTLARTIRDRYQTAYESAFGALPDMSDWPASGKPGDAAFDALSASVQDQANRLFVNVGKALDAYMRKNATSAGPLERFLAGDSTQLLEPAQRGLRVFLENGCQSCHSGPMLTDEGFHDVGFPSLAGAEPDLGRAGGISLLENSPFNLQGPYADPGPAVAKARVPSAGPGDTGAFRTPSLRNLTQTFPYGHDGALPSLNDVLAVHATALSDDDRGDLLAFFQSLNGSYPVPPWNNWPTPQ